MLQPLRPVPQRHFIHCENGKVPSWQYPGGYAESVTVPVSALARIPDGAFRRGSRPDGLRRRHHLQRAAPHEGIAR